MTQKIRYEGLHQEASLAQKAAMTAFLEHIASTGDRDVLLLLARVLDTERLKVLTEIIGQPLKDGALDFINGVIAGISDVQNLLKTLGAPDHEKVERDEDVGAQIRALIQQASKPV